LLGFEIIGSILENPTLVSKIPNSFQPFQQGMAGTWQCTAGVISTIRRERDILGGSEHWPFPSSLAAAFGCTLQFLKYNEPLHYLKRNAKALLDTFLPASASIVRFSFVNSASYPGRLLIAQRCGNTQTNSTPATISQPARTKKPRSRLSDALQHQDSRREDIAVAEARGGSDEGILRLPAPQKGEKHGSCSQLGSFGSTPESFDPLKPTGKSHFMIVRLPIRPPAQITSSDFTPLLIDGGSPPVSSCEAELR
jgi:hypothetical protein